MRCWNGSRRAATTDTGICFPVPSPQRQEASGPCSRSQEEDQTGVCRGWHHRRGLAYIPAHSRDNAGRDGRTSTHDPRLLASQQSPCDQQVSSSDSGEQTPGAREIGGCYSTGRPAIGEQINTDSIVGVGERIPGRVRGDAWWGSVLWLIGPKRTRIFFWVPCKCFENMAGTTRLELATSAVTVQ